MIAFSLEAYLVERGFRVAGPFSRAGDALTWLDSHTPDIALLDVALADGPATSLARLLRERCVPFATYSGLEPCAEAPEFAGVPWLEKGGGREALVRVLTELVERRQTTTQVASAAYEATEIGLPTGPSPSAAGSS